MTDGKATKEKRVHFLAREEIVKEWDEEAEDLEMSRSEFLRSMIHAGRRQIAQLDPNSDEESRELKEEVLNAIPEDSAAPPDEIVEAVLTPVEEEIRKDILPSLDENGEISYSPVKEGYEKA